MTVAEFYILRDDLFAITDANEHRLANMTDTGKIAFHDAVAAIIVPAFHAGLRGPALVAHVNTMLGG